MLEAGSEGAWRDGGGSRIPYRPHHQDNPAKIELLAKLNTYHVSLFASYLEKLESTADGDGTLLDQTLMMYGAGMADSNTHDSTNLPMMLIGSQDQFKGGWHLEVDPINWTAD